MGKKIMSSIKAQLSIVIILIMALPLLTVIIVSTVLTRNKIRSDIDDFNHAKAEAIEAEIESVIDQNIQALRAFATAPSTIVFITDHNGQTDSGSDLGETIFKQMQAIDNSMNDGNSTAVSGNYGMQLLRTNGDPVDITEREYYQKAMAGEDFISNVQVSISTGQMMCTIAVPVRSEDGSEVVGVVQRNYSLTKMHDILAAEVYEDKHEIVIVDRNGDVVAHSNHLIDVNNPESQAGNPFYTDSRGSKTTGSYTSPWMGENWIISWLKEPESGWVVASCRVESVALKSLNQTLIIMLVIGVVAFIIAFILSIRFSSRIATPIRGLAVSVQELTSGNLNATFDEKAATRSDEIGAIANSSIELAKKLREVIGRSKEMADGLKQSGLELTGSSSQASQASGQVSEAVEEVSKGAASQAESVQTAASEMVNIGENVEEISDSTSELTEASQNMEKNCEEAMVSLKTLISQSEKVSASVNDIGDTINRTNEGANEISGFTEAINSIATQTNLLSLNASIEAARAGEAGKGFAVVAAEISNLASQSKESADKINEIVTRLMQDAASSVEVMNSLRDNCNEQETQLDATRSRMESMEEGITAVAHSADVITNKVNGLREAKNHLSSLIDDLSAISEENAASTEETNASMAELNSTFSVINESAGSLEKSAEELDDMIGFFRLD